MYALSQSDAHIRTDRVTHLSNEGCTRFHFASFRFVFLVDITITPPPPQRFILLTIHHRMTIRNKLACYIEDVLYEFLLLDELEMLVPSRDRRDLKIDRAILIMRSVYIHLCCIFISLISRYRDREGAGESFSNQRSEEGAARLAGTRGRHHDAHREGLCTC